MNWHKGNIEEAVILTKEKRAIFVVFVEGEDDDSRKISGFINSDDVRNKLQSGNFVCIKLRAGSDDYTQFTRIFQIVPVPSVFFIGDSGVPLEIATGLAKSPDELNAKIDSALKAFNGSKNETDAGERASSSTLASDRPAQPAVDEGSPAQDKMVHEDPNSTATARVDGTTRAPEPVLEPLVESVSSTNLNTAPPSKPTTSAAARENSTIPNHEQIGADTRRHMRQREENISQDKDERQDLRDREMRETANRIKRERELKAQERQRILAQIAADRAESSQRRIMEEEVQRARAAAAMAEHEESSFSTDNADAVVHDRARIQFRFFNGEHKSHTFPSSHTLGEVRSFLNSQYLAAMGIKNFRLATTYPRRDFNVGDHDHQTLQALGLVPTAVILVMSPEEGNKRGGVVAAGSRGVLGLLTIILGTMISPVMLIYNYFRNVFARNDQDGIGQNNEPSGRYRQALGDEVSRGPRLNAVKRRHPSTGASNSNHDFDSSEDMPSTSSGGRRYAGGRSNIHRLSDKRRDSDDENATWNGNSTQQQ